MIFFDRTAAHTGKHHTNGTPTRHSAAKGHGGPRRRTIYTVDETALPYYSVHSHTTC